MSEKKESSLVNNAGAAAGLIGIALSKELGIVLLIPIAFSFLSFFILKYIDKKLKAKNISFGGLGTTYPESIPYKGLLALELGHVLWGVLGISIYLSGTFKTGFEFDNATFIEAATFIILVIFFIIKPNWLSILLLVAYHCYAIININNSFDNLSDFPSAIRETLERGYATHIIFHGMALFGFGWLSYALLSKGRTFSVLVKSHFGRKRIKSNITLDGTQERLTKLQELYNSGLINEFDFESKKTEILRDL